MCYKPIQSQFMLRWQIYAYTRTEEEERKGKGCQVGRPPLQCPQQPDVPDSMPCSSWYVKCNDTQIKNVISFAYRNINN